MADHAGTTAYRTLGHRAYLHAKLNISSHPELFSMFIRELGFADNRGGEAINLKGRSARSAQAEQCLLG